MQGLCHLCLRTDYVHVLCVPACDVCMIFMYVQAPMSMKCEPVGTDMNGKYNQRPTFMQLQLENVIMRFEFLKRHIMKLVVRLKTVLALGYIPNMHTWRLNHYSRSHAPSRQHTNLVHAPADDKQAGVTAPAHGGGKHALVPAALLEQLQERLAHRCW
ncbi:hypothetical protein NDU88_008706 [Pleurodeles waltl]|uniref:Uncharacterized protein n=1 Tax=Pleurodeles waltl TaxID=8319 RepID=A0AAV7PV36_PLEWA|nr:hypothetical protein NDU88_008706 [Pleurodeles waltl]